MRIQLFAALLCFVPLLGLSQHSQVLFGKTPDWIRPQQYDEEAQPPAGQESGYYYLLLDRQENTIKQERFHHYAYKILTTEGVQAMSDLTFDYDPAYEELVLHQVVVHRGKERISQLPDEINPIQREQSMDRHLYDGSLTAVINLKDIRVNDIVEYSYTTRGYNPVFNGHISRKFYFNFTLPYESSFTRLIVRSSPALHFEYRNADIKAAITKSDGVTDYSWTLNHVSALITDSNVPDWYDPNQRVMITDLTDWGEVAKWATKHFEVAPADMALLRKKIGNRFHSGDNEKDVLDAVRFVQDEVRYLGFEDGLNSHKPHSPAVIFDQKFGDCKDKSLLLCAILRLNDIEAFPVLANTNLRNQISGEVPSFDAFNHCVVQLKLNNRYYYVDPTISNQGGTVKTTVFPSYGKGLVVKPTTTDLIDFPATATPSEISEAQTFEITRLGEEAIMHVRTTYTGMEADNIRSFFLNNSLESVQKDYQSYYGNLYPDLEVTAPLSKHDEREGNIFTVEENYRIPSFWKQSIQNEAQMYCEVYPQTLENYFNVAKSSNRTSPYRLPYPVSYHHYIHIKLPTEWNIVPNNRSIETDFYTYEYLAKYENKEVSLQTHYETKQDFIPLSAFDKFVTDHQSMMNNLRYQLTYNKNVVLSKPGLSWMAVIVAGISLASGLWLAFHLFFKYDPKPKSEFSEGFAIGGWLVLPALGLIISPFRLVFDLFNMPELYNRQVWTNLLVMKRYGLFTFLLIEHIYNIVLLPFTIVVLVLFFQKRSSVPRLMTILLASRCLIAVGDGLVAMQNKSFFADTTVYRTMIQAIVGAAIWIPYFNVSDRVKETFVNRIEEDDDTDAYVPATQSAGSLPGPDEESRPSEESSFD